MSDVSDWGVFVDETRVFAIGGDGSEWWALFHLRQPQERMTCLKLSIAGGYWHVACESQDDAEMLLAVMTERGVHPKCARVARLSACLKVAVR